MGLQFHGKNKVRPGGPNVALKRPDLRTVKRIGRDGNCLFRSFAYIISGSEDQHMAVRAVILNHMVDIAHFLLGPHIKDPSSVQGILELTIWTEHQPGVVRSKCSTHAFCPSLVPERD